VNTTTRDAVAARTRMVGRLTSDGALRDPEWIEAFRAIPRELFVPRFYSQTITGRWSAVDDTDPDYIEKVYEVTSLVTQLDGDDNRWDAARDEPQTGAPTSSSSDPALMATMLEALDASEGDRVLEVGTGTGYNAALMAHRLGADHVTSIEVDETLAAAARRRLHRLGYWPTVVTGDGAAGVPGGGPFDRIIATASAPAVPPAWLAQTATGGKILLNLYSQLGGGALLLLTVTGPDHAEGHILSAPGSFMPLRAHQPSSTTQERLRVALHDGDAERTRTDVPGEIIHHPDAGLFIGLIVRDVAWIGFTPEGGDPQQWLLAADGSWAMRDHQDGVEQQGRRSIWDEIAIGYQTWERLGRPTRGRLGITVTPGHHQLWLDTPDHEITELPR